MISIQHVSKTYDVPKKAARRARGKSAGIDTSYAASVSGNAVLAGAAVSQAAAEVADALRPAVALWSTGRMSPTLPEARCVRIAAASP